MSRRHFSSSAAATSLTASITTGATSISVGAITGFPVQYPYTLIIDPETASEEVVEVTAGTGTTLTVTRGVDGTTALAHTSGAVVKHGVSARDFDEANSHVNASSGVHGVTGSVVGTTDTQTLTGKTLTAPTINTPTIDGDTTLLNGALQMTRAGAAIELGAPGTSNTPLIDFHSSASSTDYDARIIASGGDAATGNGVLVLEAYDIGLTADAGGNVYVNEGGLVLVSGNLFLNQADAGIELGQQGADNDPYIDFHSSLAGPDYDVRIQAVGGDGTNGNGGLNIIADTVDFLTVSSVQINGGEVVTQGGTQTLTAKTIDLTDNTVTGTLAEFSAAVSDADLVGVATTQTLTGKTLTSPTINSPTITNPTITGGSIAGAGNIISTSGSIGLTDGAREIILGYNGSGGLSIGNSTPATHPNGAVLWFNGVNLICRKPGGGDVVMA